jgi:hypothetical protein
MKLFLIFLYLLEYSFSLLKRSNDGKFVVKFSEPFYKRLESERDIEEFKDKIINSMKQQHRKTNSSSVKNKMKRTEEFNDLNIYYDDFITKERTIKFYISQQEECNVLVNDTILYQQNEKANIVEHMILHNNAEHIDPRGVYSSEVDINYFVFNKKINLYSVFFNNTNRLGSYNIEYDYMANGLIKEENDHIGLSNNTFLWKLYNENTNSFQKLRIEIYFNIDKGFQHEDVLLMRNNIERMEFNKTIVVKDGGEVVLYTWQGELKAQEVMVLQTRFPLYFDNCGTDYITFPMILVGAIFIVFLILVLYLIVSSMLFDDV